MDHSAELSWSVVEVVNEFREISIQLFNGFNGFTVVVVMMLRSFE